MSSSPVDSAVCLVFALMACIAACAYLDGRPWHLQVIAWAQTSGLYSLPSDVAFEDFEEEAGGPEGILLRQLSSTTDASAVGALHVALARIYDATGRPDDALRELENARDSARVAAEVAPPPLLAGMATVSAGKERDGLAEARLALVRAYLKHGRAKDADAEITKARNDEFFVGLEELHLTEIIREQGHAARALGQFDMALHHYTFARSRVERSADSDRAAAELVEGLLKDEAATAHLGQDTRNRVGIRYPSGRSSGISREDAIGQPGTASQGIRYPRLMSCPGGVCTAGSTASDGVSFLQKASVLELGKAAAPFTKKVLALLAEGETEQAEQTCLGKVNGGADSDHLTIAGARICLGIIAREKGQLIDARQHVYAALVSALSTGSAENFEAERAYGDLFDLQTKFHAEGSPRSLLAAQAIYREAQMAADNADVPESKVRTRAERKLKENAKAKR